MPVIRIPDQEKPRGSELAAAIVEELRLGAESPNSEPKIVLIGDEKLGPLSVYVIWKAWEGIGHAKRGDIIMDALEMHFGSQIVMSVVAAMGVTPSEAEAMDLPLNA